MFKISSHLPMSGQKLTKLMYKLHLLLEFNQFLCKVHTIIYMKVGEFQQTNVVVARKCGYTLNPTWDDFTLKILQIVKPSCTRAIQKKFKALQNKMDVNKMLGQFYLLMLSHDQFLHSHIAWTKTYNVKRNDDLKI